jgi:hypothetical protein
MLSLVLTDVIMILLSYALHVTMCRLTCDLEMLWQMMSSLYLDTTFMAL